MCSPYSISPIYGPKAAYLTTSSAIIGMSIACRVAIVQTCFKSLFSECARRRNTHYILHGFCVAIEQEWYVWERLRKFPSACASTLNLNNLRLIIATLACSWNDRTSRASRSKDCGGDVGSALIVPFHGFHCRSHIHWMNQKCTAYCIGGLAAIPSVKAINCLRDISCRRMLWEPRGQRLRS